MKRVCYIGLAGALGAILRTWVGLIWGNEVGFPVATLTVNLIGTLLLCFIGSKLANGMSMDKEMSAAIQTGFLGSFTTFSAFSMETVLLFESGQMITAFLYISMSVIGGLGAGLLGFSLGRKRRVL